MNLPDGCPYGYPWAKRKRQRDDVGMLGRLDFEAFTAGQFSNLVNEFPFTYRKLLDEDSAQRWRGRDSLVFLPQGSPFSTTRHTALRNP